MLDNTAHTLLWTARSNQLILKELNPEYSLEGPMLKPLWPPDMKTLMLGKIEGKRRRGQQKMRWLDGMSLSKLREIVKDREACCAAAHGAVKSQT